jgi:hypothetical protein
MELETQLCQQYEGQFSKIAEFDRQYYRIACPSRRERAGYYARQQLLRLLRLQFYADLSALPPTGSFSSLFSSEGIAMATVLGYDCPYCNKTPEFQKMVLFVGEQFICWKCGHTLWAEEPSYECSCPSCRRTAE